MSSNKQNSKTKKKTAKKLNKTTEELLEQTLQGLKQETESSPDLDDFFEEIKEKKKEFDNNDSNIDESNLDETIEIDSNIVNGKKRKKKNKFKTFCLITAFLFAIAYYLLNIKSALVSVDYIKDIITSSTLLLVFFFIILALTGNRKIRNSFSILSSILIIGIISLNILYSKDIIKLPTLTVIEDFTNQTVASAIKWANENDIKLIQNYEYSDNIEDGNIIMQSVEAGTVAKLIDELTLTISNGPNFDKDVIINNWIGRNIDELIKFINDNHLNNVEIKFETNNDIDRDLIIKQSTKGEIKRNSFIKFTVSLGKESELKDTELIDLENKTLFDATLFLKRNGIKYEVSYDYSDTIRKNRVISQSIKEGKKVTPKKDIVKLVISKGKKITVPDFSKATVDEVVEWIINNNLKVEFIEKYNKDIDEGKLITLNVKTGDDITEGTRITITTSKGALKVPQFKSVSDAKSWASDNGVTIVERYEYNDKSKGSIISQSAKEGDKIDPVKDSITLVISYGKPSIIPYTIGKSRGSAQSACNNAGINCSFYYTGYSQAARDTVTVQSIAAGNKVLSGTYMSIGLSSGPAQTFTIHIQDSWFEAGSADGAISNIKSKLASAAPDVNFNFIKRKHNTYPAGYVHPDSPIKGGEPYQVTQGQTYTIIITD